MEKLDKLLDAWKTKNIQEKDYKTIKKYYKIKDLPLSLLKGIPFNSEIILGYSGEFNQLNVSTAVVSGFMPSGDLHFGNKIVIDELRFFSKMGLTLFIPIADIEAFSVRKKDVEDMENLCARLICHLILNNIKVKHCKIYLQSRNSKVLSLAFFLSKYIDYSFIKKCYGRGLSPAEFNSALVMTADILFPQLLGYNNSLVPIGVDEIDHIFFCCRLTKKIREFEFQTPSAMFHKIINGVRNIKMSKSIKETTIFLMENPETACKKLLNAQISSVNIEDDPAYQLLKYMLVEKEEFIELREKLKRMNIITLRKFVLPFLKKFLMDYQEKFEKNYDKAKRFTKWFIEEKDGILL